MYQRRIDWLSWAIVIANEKGLFGMGEKTPAFVIRDRKSDESLSRWKMIVRSTN
jgi:hypothetical protein